jgi:hypothetical protein
LAIGALLACGLWLYYAAPLVQLFEVGAISALHLLGIFGGAAALFLAAKGLAFSASNGRVAFSIALALFVAVSFLFIGVILWAQIVSAIVALLGFVYSFVPRKDDTLVT